MLLMGQNNQIFDPVVAVDAVNVVNILPRLQLSPQVFLHYSPVICVNPTGYGIRLKGKFGVSFNVKGCKVRSLMSR